MFLAVQQEVGEPLAWIVARSAGADQEVGVGTIADPGLFTIDDEIVAVTSGSGFDFQHV
ncbi:hypothetical protein D3C84_1306110 [compost metagenome]